jgi:hypothetical protein
MAQFRYIGEVLQAIDQEKSVKRKREILLENMNRPLGMFLQMVFATNQWWCFQGENASYFPNYRPDEAPWGHTDTGLHLMLREIQHVYGNPRYHAKMPRIQEKVIQLCESLHPYEAEIFKAMVCGEKIPCRGLTRNFLESVYHNIFPDQEPVSK